MARAGIESGRLSHTVIGSELSFRTWQRGMVWQHESHGGAALKDRTIIWVVVGLAAAYVLFNWYQGQQSAQAANTTSGSSSGGLLGSLTSLVPGGLGNVGSNITSGLFGDGGYSDADDSGL